MISEQWINNEQMALQGGSSITTVTEMTNQNKRIMQVVEEACRMAPELAISDEGPVKMRIRKLATGVHNTRTEMTKV